MHALSLIKGSMWMEHMAYFRTTSEELLKINGDLVWIKNPINFGYNLERC